MTEKNETNEETNFVSNPLIDAVHNEKWSKLKEVTEKTVADKIHARIKAKQQDLLDKVIEK